MGLHAENDLQLASFARTARSRQPTLSGVPLGGRRSSRRARQTRQTFPERRAGRTPLSRLQRVRSGRRDTPLFHRSRRVQHQRIAEQDPPPPPAGTEQRPSIPPLEASSYPWPYQENRPHLQVLRHRFRQTGSRDRSQIARTRHHPSTRLCTRSLTTSCHKIARFQWRGPNVVPGATVYTDGLKSFRGLREAGFKHVPRNQPLRTDLRKGAASAVPLADRAIGNLQQWLIGTYHGVSRDQLQVYLDEFVFRHNRRRQPMAAFQTLLGLGTGRRPTSYQQIRGASDLCEPPAES